MESSQIPDNFDDIKNLEWKYLQMLSKRNGLKANQKKAAVIEQLGALFDEGKLVWFSDGDGMITTKDVIHESADPIKVHPPNTTMSKEEIRAMQEANKGLSQEEKQALRKAKKAEKAALAMKKQEAKATAATTTEVATPTIVETQSTSPSKEEIRAMQEANKGLSQEEKQALRKAKKAEKAALAMKKQEAKATAATTTTEVATPTIVETQSTSPSKEEIRAMQEANKGLSQEEKQALRKAKKAEKAQKATTQQPVQQQQKQSAQQQKQSTQQQQKQQQKRQQQPKQIMNKSNPNNQQPQLSGIPILGRLASESTVTTSVCCKGDTSHIHMTFLRLSLLFSSREVRGASCRAEYLLKAIKELLASIQVLPNEESLNYAQRITDILKENYEYLISQRRASSPMERIYHQVQEAINNSLETKSNAGNVRETVLEMLEVLESGIKDRKDKTVNNIAHMIDNDDVILTLGESERIKRSFLQASQEGCKFSVIVIGTRPKTTNENMLRQLVSKGIPCTLAPLNALPLLMKNTTKAIVSASQVLANGSIFADIGTAIVATTCKTYNIPMLVVADTFKFSRDVKLNVFDRCEANRESFRPHLLFPHDNTPRPEKWELEDEKDIPNFSTISFMEDLVPAGLITGIVTEHSVIPATSVASLLREMDAFQN